MRVGRYAIVIAIITAWPAIDVGTLFAQRAGAEQSENWTWCINENDLFSPDLQIGGCTAIIQSGRESRRNLAIAFGNRGMAHRAKNEYDRSIADYNEAIRLKPEVTSPYNAYTGRAEAYSSKKDYDRAIADYNTSLERTRKHGSFGVQHFGALYAHYGRGMAYYAKKDYDRAIADYDKAIELNSRNNDLYIKRGSAYYAKKDYHRAIEDYTKAIKLYPEGDTDAYLFRGLAYGHTGRHNHAIADFEKVIALDPKSARAYSGRCWGRAVGGGDLNQALSDCNESLRLKPDEPSTFESRGFVHLRLSQLERAIADYDAALKLNPQLAFSLYGRGLAKRTKGDSTAGDVDIAAAKEIQTDIDEVFRRYESFRGGFLGVAHGEVSSETATKLGLKSPRGALIHEVVDGGPAQIAAIEPGDVIVKFDGTAINKSRELSPLVADTPEGKEVQIVIIRGDQELTKKVKLGRFPGRSP